MLLPQPHFLIPVLSATRVTWIKAMSTWMNPFPGFDQKLNEFCKITSLTPGVQLRLLARLVLGYVYKLTDSTIFKKKTQKYSTPPKQQTPQTELLSIIVFHQSTDAFINKCFYNFTQHVAISILNSSFKIPLFLSNLTIHYIIMIIDHFYSKINLGEHLDTLWEMLRGLWKSLISASTEGFACLVRSGTACS